MVRDSLERFLKQEILPLYDSFDAAHGVSHAEAVLCEALGLGEKYGVNKEYCLTSAAYHDIGLRFGREEHHTHSARLLRQDERLLEWFTKDEIEEMACAVEDHRASSAKPPRSILGKILADADREYNVPSIFARTMAFGKANYPELSEAEQIERAYAHIKEKYGPEGYMAFFLEDADRDAVKREIESLLRDRALFAETCKKYANARPEKLDIDKYLQRIGVTEECPLQKATLDMLQERHLRSVPYENMDILRNVPLSLERRALYDKIVTRHRGGYCFELNELFGYLLRALGFHVRDCFARFLAGEKELPMRRHHVLLVKVPGEKDEYLCDVGVGSGSPTRPVKLAEGETQEQADATWHLTRDDYLGWVLWQYKHETWQKVFSFTEEAQLPVDYLAASFFCEHAPESPFNKEPMISLRTETGRVTLDGNEFRVFSGENVAVTVLSDIETTLRDKFGIVL